MMGQITRTLLFLLLMLTGMSAGEATRADFGQRTASEELTLVADLDVAARTSGQVFGSFAAVSGEIRNVHKAERFDTYLVATDAFPSTTPASRHDVART
jgi:uncharacterized protein YoaH (UPF0181 family)